MTATVELVPLLLLLLLDCDDDTRELTCLFLIVFVFDDDIEGGWKSGRLTIVIFSTRVLATIKLLIVPSLSTLPVAVGVNRFWRDDEVNGLILLFFFNEEDDLFFTLVVDFFTTRE